MMTLPLPPIEARQQAVAMLNQAMMPPTPRVLVSELTRCFTLTRTKAEGEDDTEAAITLYADELRSFPADSVFRVLREAPRKSRWRPDLCDLIAEIDGLTKWRRDLLADLSAAPAPFVAEPPRTDADISEIEAMCAEARQALAGTELGTG